jgi:hypothetical protein
LYDPGSILKGPEVGGMAAERCGDEGAAGQPLAAAR